jgi:hypothetical protein
VGEECDTYREVEKHMKRFIGEPGVEGSTVGRKRRCQYNIKMNLKYIIMGVCGVTNLALD